MSHPLKTRRLRFALFVLVLLTLTIGGIITPLERHLTSYTTFSTVGDGIWWAITTVTSVGYGDYYPVTTPGRILGSILSIIGVTTFGIIIALVTVELFRSENLFYWKRTVERFDRLERKLEQLEKEQHFAIKNGQPKKES